MATHLPDWERKNYTLADGKPCLFYVAFGRADGPFSVSRGTYRCAGLPAELEIMGYGPDKGGK